MATGVVLAGCTGSNHVTSSAPLPRSHPPSRAVGSVSGVDELCTGPASVRPRAATVQLIHHGVVVAISAVIAGDPAHDRYRQNVTPGRYVVRASNWSKSPRAVIVPDGAGARIDFVNDCD
jgi:hypothetical protein